MATTDSSFLRPLFYPRSIAIVGASTDPKKIGGQPLACTLQRGFKGAIYPVNANSPEVQGLKAYPSLSAIEGPVDCAIVAVPAPAVTGAIEECGRKGVKLAVVFSSGFAEAGAAGAKAQDKLLAAARAGGVRMIGPNAMGAYSLEPGFVATFTSAFEHHGGQGWPKLGGYSIVSQSGAIGVHIMVLLRERGLGVSKWVTTGNQADIEVADCIDFLADDPATEVIVAYIEGAKDGRKLAAALERARANKKPVLVLKVGTSESGAAAAAAHTASLAGSDVAYDTLLRQCGAYRATTLAELTDVAAACRHGRYPADPRIAFVSISGGVGILMADQAEASGLKVDVMPEAVQKAMLAENPMVAPRNPIDTGAPGMSDMTVTPKYMATALTEGGYPSMVGFLTHVAFVERQWSKLKPGILDVRAKFPDRVLALSMTIDPKTRNALEDDGFIVCDDPSRAVECIAALWRIGESFRAAGAKAPPPVLPDALPAPADGAAGERAALQVLSAIGVPAVPHALATSADMAAQAAEEIGFPVALKLASPDVLHKSDIGGVVLNLTSADAAAAAYRTVVERAKAAAPKARIDGALVAKMVGGGVETIIGVNRDPVLGPVVMFGIGGIFVEVFKDVAFRIAPFGADEAMAMIRSIKGFPLLDGARGRPKADVAALADAIARLSVYASRSGDALQSIDINPFIVLPAGQGGFAVDALVVPRT